MQAAPGANLTLGETEWTRQTLSAVSSWEMVKGSQGRQWVKSRGTGRQRGWELLVGGGILVWTHEKCLEIVLVPTHFREDQRSVHLKVVKTACVMLCISPQ